MKMKVTTVTTLLLAIIIALICYTPVISQGTVQYDQTLTLGIGKFQGFSWSPTQDKIVVATNAGLYLYSSNWELLKSVPIFVLYSDQEGVSLDWSRDGNWLAVSRSTNTFSDDGTYLKQVSLFDSNLVSVGNPVLHSGHNFVRWNADSTKFITTWANGLKVWSRLGQFLSSFPQSVDYNLIVRDVIWLHGQDSKVVTLEDTGGIKLINLANNQIINQYLPENGSEFISSITASPDGTKIAVGTSSGLIQIRHPENFSLLSELFGHTQIVYQLLWKSNLLASASAGRIVRVWDIDSSETVISFTTEQSTPIISFSGNNSSIVVNINDRSLHVYNIQSGQKLSELKNAFYDTRIASWNTDGSQIITTQYGKPFQFFNAVSGMLVREFASDVPYGSQFLEWNFNKTKAITANDNLTIWSVSENLISILNSIPLSGFYITATAWHPTDLQIAGISSSGIINVWNVVDGSLVRTFQVNRGGGKKISWDSSGRFLVVTENHSLPKITVWDASNGSLVKSFSEPSFTFDWSPDRTKIAVHETSGLNIYDVLTWNLISRFSTPLSTSLELLKWSPNGLQIAAVSDDYSIVMFDVNFPNNVPTVVKTFFDLISFLEWSPSSERFVVVLGDIIHIFTKHSTVSVTPTPTLTPTLTPTPRPDTPAIYRPSTSTFHFPTLPSVTFGNPNDHPITGDWDGDGVDTLGVFDPLRRINDQNYIGTNGDPCPSVALPSEIRFPYDREAAAAFAMSNAYQNNELENGALDVLGVGSRVTGRLKSTATIPFANNIYSSDILEHNTIAKTGSALFTSEAIWMGGLPMTRINANDTSCTSPENSDFSNTVWRYCTSTKYATIGWKLHGSLLSYFAEFKSPYPPIYGRGVNTTLP
jgi:WD40 repeat protein